MDAVVRQKEPATDRPRLRKEKPASKGTEEKEETVEAVPSTLLVPLERTGSEVAPPPAWTRGSESPREGPTAASPACRGRSRSLDARTTSRDPRLGDLPVVQGAPPTPLASLTSQLRTNHRSSGSRSGASKCAPSAPAPLPRKLAPRSEPKLTLDAYLKSRKDGAP